MSSLYRITFYKPDNEVCKSNQYVFLDNYNVFLGRLLILLSGDHLTYNAANVMRGMIAAGQIEEARIFFQKNAQGMVLEVEKCFLASTSGDADMVVDFYSQDLDIYEESLKEELGVSGV